MLGDPGLVPVRQQIPGGQQLSGRLARPDLATGQDVLGDLLGEARVDHHVRVELKATTGASDEVRAGSSYVPHRRAQIALRAALLDIRPEAVRHVSAARRRTGER